MVLEKLKLKNFRIYPSFTASPKNGINILTGSNGVGKTSILEAISLGASAESFRFGKSEDFIKSGEGSSSIELKVNNADYSDKIEVEITKKGKSLRLNNKKVTQLRNLLQVLPHIAFSPCDHKIINGDSYVRRNFVNKAISNLDFEYAEHLRRYNKALFQRNRLLKMNRGRVQDLDRISREIEVWDKQLVEYGEKLISYRKNYLEKIVSYFNEQYQNMTGKDAHLELIYQYNRGISEEMNQINKSSQERGNMEEDVVKFPEDRDLSYHLRQGLFEDLLCGSTRVGPHKDEVLFMMGGNRIKTYGSQGEKRTAVLALRLAEVELYKKEKDKIPVLLIDDISSELDLSRRKALVNILKKGDSQVFITATELPSDLLKEVKSSINHYDLDLMKENRYQF